jgi:hypothetical protein
MSGSSSIRYKEPVENEPLNVCLRSAASHEAESGLVMRLLGPIEVRNGRRYVDRERTMLEEEAFAAAWE